MSHQPNGEDSIPTWLWITSWSLLVFTIMCFGVMFLGML